jgi:hypothetical protein
MITFQNKGLIDLRAVTTFGVSAKDGPNPIGFFGTGLKYAIACVLRNSGRITLWHGRERYDFFVQQAEIRGKEFGIVTMEDPEGTRTPLGFTTHLGARWEPWMVFRELHCNTLDEGGETFSGHGTPKDGYTTITVTGWVALEDAYAKRSEIVLETAPVSRSDTIEFHAAPSKLLYCRGVRAAELSKPCIFTYNLAGGAELTEDRTIKWLWLAEREILCAVLKSTDRAFLDRWLTAPLNTWEHEVALTDSGADPSETFLDVVGELRLQFDRPLNKTAGDLFAQRRGPTVGYDTVQLSPEQARTHAEAVRLVKALGADPDPFPTEYVRSLGPGVYGQALLRERRILLATKILDLGVRTTASTLLEETLHLSHGFEDCSRDFQNFLLDRLLAVAEEHYKEVTA